MKIKTKMKMKIKIKLISPGMSLRPTDSYFKRVMFIDDNFIGNVPWTKQLISEIKDSFIGRFGLMQSLGKLARRISYGAQ